MSGGEFSWGGTSVNHLATIRFCHTEFSIKKWKKIPIFTWFFKIKFSSPYNSVFLKCDITSGWFWLSFKLKPILLDFLWGYVLSMITLKNFHRNHTLLGYFHILLITRELKFLETFRHNVRRFHLFFQFGHSKNVL